jgi:hypothetical protein
MQEQHKAMFIALRDGKFDPIVEGGADASQSTRALVAESPPSKPPPPPGPTLATPPPGVVAPTPADRTDPSVAPVLGSDEGPPTIRQPPPAPLTLDIDSLERAAAANQAVSPAMHAVSDLPPPPANIFRERTATGKYRITPIPPVAAAAAASSGEGPAPSRQPASPARTQPPASGAAERRYAPTRPASIFGQTRPQQGKSIFGEDLMSDKSLDEVILSYLAEDLDDKK